MTKSTKFSVGFIFLTILISNAVIASLSGSAEEKVRVSHKNLIRTRRQLCPDGTYQHEGRTCCLCGAGQRVKHHCVSKPDDGTCEFCEQMTYSDHPSSEEFCKPCTSCDHPNANLETEEKCTPARDAKCRCKPNHFCSSNSTGMCKICQPCDTCWSAGSKELCALYCSGETSNVGAIVGGVFAVVAVVAVAAILGFICWKKKSSADIISPEIPLLKVPDVDMQPLLPDIANQLGWTNTKEIAMRSGIPQTVIESVKLDHPQHSEEMTLDLLGRWVESRGKGASNDLIKILQKSGKNDTAEKILAIFKNANPVA